MPEEEGLYWSDLPDLPFVNRAVLLILILTYLSAYIAISIVSSNREEILKELSTLEKTKLALASVFLAFMGAYPFYMLVAAGYLAVYYIIELLIFSVELVYK